MTHFIFNMTCPQKLFGEGTLAQLAECGVGCLQPRFGVIRHALQAARFLGKEIRFAVGQPVALGELGLHLDDPAA